MKKILFILIFNLQFLIFNHANAQTVGVDSTFGLLGVSQISIYNNQTATCRNLIPLPDGRIIATGFAYSGAQTEFALTRIFNNGTIDLSFGTQGVTTTAVNAGGTSFSYTSLLQPDGKILLGGNYFTGTGYAFVVVRYDTTGTLDNSFGVGGMATFSVDSGLLDDAGFAMALQGNGKILLAGVSYSASDNDFTVIRFNTNGEIDTTFGNHGAAVTPIGLGNDNCYAMTVQNDDRIVLAGDISVGSAYNFALVRYTADGLLDPSFGTGGITIHALGANDDDYGYSVTLQQPDNKIIIGGATDFGGSYDFVMLRFDSSGVLDNSFGNAGVTLTDFSGSGSDDYARDILLQSDGKILLAGKTTSLGSRFALARYSNNGIIDNTFGLSGKSTVSIASSQHNCYSVAIDINNKILVGGQVAALFKFIIVRFKSGLAVSIDETNEPLNNNLLVYPNPAIGEFTIGSNSDLLASGKKVELRITDINGREVFAGQLINKKQISMTVDFPPGIYIVQLLDEDTIETQKLIIQKRKY